MNSRPFVALAVLAARLGLGADTPTEPVAAPAPAAAPAAGLVPGSAPAAPTTAEPVPAPGPTPPGTELAPEPAPDVVPLTGELRLNFQGAPIDTVLDYLSRAGGFVIVRDTPVAGTIDIVSHAPLSADEAVALLHTVLSDRGYGVIRTERVLRIVRRDDARNRDLPVVTGNDPDEVPRTGELVTQIVPLHHTTAAKLIETLKPLIPAQTTISANEDSNALVVTDTRVNIRRMLEIIKALDTAVSSILDIAVIPLRYADAVQAADLVNKVYETPVSRSTSQSGSNRGGFMSRMRGFGPPGFGGDADATATDTSREAKATASYVKAVADENGNAVVVTAPAETLEQIRQLLQELDAPSEDTTTVRVLPLRYADATQVANMLASLYPDTSASAGRQGGRFGGAMFGPGGPIFGPGQGTQSGSTSTQSQRKLSQAKVIAVADTRTNAVIVSASATTMDEIAGVVKELDATPANVPTVYVYQLQNADVTRTKEILDNMFEDLDNARSTSRTSTQGRSTTSRSTSGTGAGSGGGLSGAPGASAGAVGSR